NRLKRIEGQARGISRMVDEEVYCIDILTQISALNSALENKALGLLDDHLRHCVLDAAREGGEAAEIKLKEASDAVRRLVKACGVPVDRLSPLVGGPRCGYSPILPAVESSRALAGRTYRASESSRRCLVVREMVIGSTPAAAADVACPARSECPETQVWATPAMWA